MMAILMRCENNPAVRCALHLPDKSEPLRVLAAMFAERLVTLCTEMLQRKWADAAVVGAVGSSIGGGPSALVGAIATSITAQTACASAAAVVTASAAQDVGFFGAEHCSSAVRIRKFNQRDVTYLVTLLMHWSHSPLQAVGVLAEKMRDLDEDNEPDQQ
jgi:hypothetical protein